MEMLPWTTSVDGTEYRWTDEMRCRTVVMGLDISLSISLSLARSLLSPDPGRALPQGRWLLQTVVPILV